MGFNHSLKFLAIGALITIFGAQNAHAFSGSAQNNMAKKPPRIIIDQGNIPTPTPPAACNFLVACAAGTHEDYNLCQCVKDDPCPDYACAAPPEGCHYEPVDLGNGCSNPCGQLVCKPKDADLCPPPPSCAQPAPPCVFQPSYDKNGCIVGCGSYCPDGGPRPLPPVHN